jgi:hypothetical protein
MIFYRIPNSFFLEKTLIAGVVELADAPDSKSGGGNSVWVRLPPPAPYKINNLRGFMLFLNWVICADCNGFVMVFSVFYSFFGFLVKDTYTL